jgi:FKBP-type peptidyl-prolyl cis-trans isomerase FklB
MNRKSVALGSAVLVAAAGFVGVGVWRRLAAARSIETPKRKLSYAIGVSMANNVQRTDLDIDADAVASGLKDAFAGRDLLMSKDALREATDAFQNELREKQAQAVKTIAEANSKAAEAYLAENVKEAGVVALPSGLQYKILAAGHGKRPSATDAVECHYRGSRIDGTEFQSSHGTGQPATFRIGAVIPGLREALTLMPVGSKWRIFVPPQLAYGERGLADKDGGARAIGPNELLTFEMELLGIKNLSTSARQAVAAKAPSRRE